MKHLEPRPAPVISDVRPPKKSLSRATLLLAAAATVGTIGFSMSQVWSPHAGDQLSETEKTKLVNDFAHMQSFSLETVAEKDLDKALESMRLAPAARRDLQQAIASANDGSPQQWPTSTKLVWLTLWDFAANDGDIVHLSSAGYDLDVALTNTLTQVAVPVDATSTILVSGVRDGGGGITIALMTNGQQASLPIMQVGDSIPLPIH